VVNVGDSGFWKMDTSQFVYSRGYKQIVMYKVENATALIWKMLQVAESTFRRLKGAELLPAVYAGAHYVDGVKQSVRTQQQLAA
jgi:hypothetical protein